MYPRRSVPLHPGDQKILDNTRELSRQLGIRKTIVRGVGWADRIGLYKFQPDMIAIYKGEMIIHKSLMDKLGSDELKPLIASTLQHRENIGPRTLKGILKFMLPAFLGMFFVIYIAEHVFSANSMAYQIAIPASIILGTGLVIFSLTRVFKISTRVWFDADRRSAEMLGTDMFLGVLEKMEAMGFGGRRFREQPGVRDRIANLRRSGTVKNNE